MLTITTQMLNAPIKTVTVLEDRALIQRQGTSYFKAGLWRVTIVPVTPILADKSLRAELIGESLGARVNDVRIRREKMVKESAKPEELQHLLKQVRQLRETSDSLSDDVQIRKYSVWEFNLILNKTLAEIPVDAAWGQWEQQDWRSHLQTLFQQLRTLPREIISLKSEQSNLATQIRDGIKHLESLDRPDWESRATIEADLSIIQEGEYTINFDYLVPNALWRPGHTAHLQLGENPLITVNCDGYVWQNTGEDWENVDLIFSTARPSLGIDPPLLKDDYLTVKEKTTEVRVEAREQQIQTSGILGAPPRSDFVLPGVDDGGEVRVLRAPQKVTISSDGRPDRVPLFSFTSPVTISYLTFPEINPQIVLKSEQTNTSSSPILAGPVDLIRTSEYVGKTSTLFIAPGEKFALGWGPDANLRIQRVEDKKQKQDPITRWKTNTITIKLYLSNIGDTRRTLQVTERVPISELEQVKIEVLLDQTTPKVQPNSNGFCTWTVPLEPYSQKQLMLVYKVNYGPEVKGLDY